MSKVWRSPLRGGTRGGARAPRPRSSRPAKSSARGSSVAAVLPRLIRRNPSRWFGSPRSACASGRRHPAEGLAACCPPLDHPTPSKRHPATGSLLPFPERLVYLISKYGLHEVAELLVADVALGSFPAIPIRRPARVGVMCVLLVIITARFEPFIV